MNKDERFSVMSSYLGMYQIFDDKKGEPLSSRKVLKLLDENEKLKEEFDELKRENRELNELCGKYVIKIGRLEAENEGLISIKRFADKYGINIFIIDKAFRECWNNNRDLVKENQKLKTQLLHGDGVCDICKYEYLVKTGEHYVSKCKKGHDECSKIDLAFCEDFEVKECKE